METQQPQVSQQPIIVQSANKRSAIDYIFAALFVGGGLYGLSYLIKKNKEEKEAAKIGVEQQATSASAIQQAFNPSGFLWLKPIDGTNAKQIMDAIIKAFNEGKKYSDIASSYKSLTKGNLLNEDLQKELSPDQYKAFTQVISVLSKRPIIARGDSISLKATVIIRKTPYINGTPRLLDRRGNSIDILSDVGMFVGIATGKQLISVGRDTYLSNNQSTATLYIEIQVFGSNKKIYTVWVAASQIQINHGVKPSSFPKLYILNVSNYEKAEAVNHPYLD